MIREFFEYIQPFIVAFNELIIIAFVLWWCFFKRRKSFESNAYLSPEITVINWSAHPFPKVTWANSLDVYTPEQIPHFNVENWETIEESVEKLILDLPKNLQKRLLQADSNIVIAIPQLAGALSVLLAIVHGRTGGFPKITCSLRNKEGSFYLPLPVDLNKIRLNNRQKRNIHI